MVNKVIQTYGHIDVLINSAGAGILGTLTEITFSDMKKGLELNFNSVAYVSRMVADAMKQSH